MLPDNENTTWVWTDEVENLRVRSTAALPVGSAVLPRETTLAGAEFAKRVFDDVQEEAQRHIHGAEDLLTRPASRGFQTAVARALTSASVPPHVKACCHWWMWGTECWMGAGLGELQLSEFVSVAEGGFGDYPGAHCLAKPFPAPRAMPAPTAASAPSNSASAHVFGGGGVTRLVRSLAEDTLGCSVWTGWEVRSIRCEGGDGWRPIDAPRSPTPPPSRSRGARWVVTGEALPSFPDTHNEAGRAIVCMPPSNPAREEPPPRHTWTARAVVITVPLGVLKAGRISIHPPLPPSTRSAIARLRMGHYKKIVLRYPRRLWPADADKLWGIVGPTDSEFGELNEAESVAAAAGVIEEEWLRGSAPRALPELVGPAHPVRPRYIENYEAMKGAAWEGVVAVVLCGADVVRAAAMGVTEEEMVQMAHRAVQVVSRAMWAARGEAMVEVVDPAGAMVTQWEKDELIHGAYSFFPRGAEEGDIESLGLPWSCSVGEEAGDAGPALFFAGEATNGEYMGSIHAALHSAERAARQVSEWLGE